MKKAVPFTFNILYYGAIAFMMPFIVLYYQKMGFNGVQIGLLAGIAPLLTLIGAPLWTGIADATRHHRLIMSIAITVTIAAVLIFPALKTFGQVLLLVILIFFFAAPIVSFADNATMSMLSGEKEKYGRIRLGGSIGFGLVALLAGMLVQAHGLKMAFWGYAALMFLGLIVSQGLVHGKPESGTSMRAGFRTLLTDRRWILFLALAFVSGMAAAATNSYLFPYMKELNANETTMGIALTIATISELPVLFFADRLIKRFKAHGLLLLGTGFTGVRLLLLAAFNFTTGILVVQILQGLTLPVIWVAGVSYADEHAPAGMRATAQGLFGATVFGFGAAAGGLLGGLLLGGMGGRGLFLIFGVIVFLGFAIVTLIERRLSAEQHG
jgi:PPP family 3-phenylpropionic acid transporter